MEKIADFVVSMQPTVCLLLLAIILIHVRKTIGMVSDLVDRISSLIEISCEAQHNPDIGIGISSGVEITPEDEE